MEAFFDTSGPTYFFDNFFLGQPIGPKLFVDSDITMDYKIFSVTTFFFVWRAENRLSNSKIFVLKVAEWYIACPQEVSSHKVVREKSYDKNKLDHLCRKWLPPRVKNRLLLVAAISFLLL